MSETVASAGPLSRLRLHDLHIAHGAKLVPFAGYSMPVQYAAGVLKFSNNSRIVPEDLALIRRATPLGRNTLRSEQILRSPRDAMKRASKLALHHFRFRRPCLRHRELFRESHNGE